MKNIDCPCKRTKCERYGNCDACREHHKNKKSFAFCDRLKKKSREKLTGKEKEKDNFR